jgi:hypothetical protein
MSTTDGGSSDANATASVKGVNIPLEVAVIHGPYVDPRLGVTSASSDGSTGNHLGVVQFTPHGVPAQSVRSSCNCVACYRPQSQAIRP